ncbi:heparan-alpha-glucosaminide N-acetyltransferase domain-containing protein [Thermococcus peptonophilus]|uniref:heparan-alpha-glucosaminide N-acetyltransferase domain-containing protein n=1 Tax=Thermococcus peptonophilus TaxID=53952 RepID=UPI003465C5CD
MVRCLPAWNGWGGSFFYPNGTRKRHLPPLPQSPAVHFLTFMGRHTLKVYLIHQPIFVGLLRLLYGPIPGLPF